MAATTVTELLEAVRDRLRENPDAGFRAGSTYSDPLNNATVYIGASDRPPPGPHNTYAAVTMLSLVPVHAASGSSLHRFTFRITIFNRMLADRAGHGDDAIISPESGLGNVCDSVDTAMVHSFLNGHTISPVLLIASAAPVKEETIDGMGWLRASRDFTTQVRIDRSRIAEVAAGGGLDRG